MLEHLEEMCKREDFSKRWTRDEMITHIDAMAEIEFGIKFDKDGSFDTEKFRISKERYSFHTINSNFDTMCRLYGLKKHDRKDYFKSLQVLASYKCGIDYYGDAYDFAHYNLMNGDQSYAAVYGPDKNIVFHR